ncbi:MULTISPECIES: lasso peptide biosynthesis B2 protein [unclassified Sphingobium]|uniref:lasso peptide biosynthesis B2 protein n=1 Tax=unclassified Sphingobium TaxID=2611147 RepID=UPI0038673657
MLSNTAWHLRRKNIRGLIDDLRARKTSRPKSPEGGWRCTLQTIWGLQAARALITAENKCLLRSMSLARYLAGRGIDAKLVIGVKLAPFGAHSWVQDNDRILNDRHEIVRIFTPILVI